MYLTTTIVFARYNQAKDKKKLAIAALIRLAINAAATALKPSLATSARRFGAIVPSPPSKIAIDEKLAKPQRAKLTTA